MKLNLREALGKLVFRRVDKIVKGYIKEVRWYTGPGEYEVIKPREFTEKELDKHVEFLVQRYHFFTSPASLREDEWKGRAIFGSSFRHATVDPISLELTVHPTKVLVHKGDLVCGFVRPPINQGQAPSFTEWFICSEQALRAWTMIMYDEHKTLIGEPRLRFKMISGNNRLCTNTYLKKLVVNEQNDTEMSSDDKNSFYHLRTETPSTEWVHIYVALVLMARYGEIPSDDNIPQSLDPDALLMNEWHLPEDYVDKVIALWT